MSNPYGPPLETTEDWNDALACCCGMPLPPEPLLEIERLVVYGVLGGYAAEGWVTGDPLYRRTIATYTGADPFIQYYLYDAIVGMNIQTTTILTAFNVTLTDNGGTTFGSPATFTVELPVTIAEARSQIDSTTAAELDFDSTDYTPDRWTGYIGDLSLVASRVEVIDYGMNVTLIFFRYRWRIPVEHLGDYFKITWDVLHEPVGWDDEEIPEEDRPLRYSRKNLTVEWEGPGTGDQDDPSWIAGDWQALDAPAEVGIVKPINIRYEQIRREAA